MANTQRPGIMNPVYTNPVYWPRDMVPSGWAVVGCWIFEKRSRVEYDILTHKELYNFSYKLR